MHIIIIMYFEKFFAFFFFGFCVRLMTISDDEYEL